MAWEKLTSRVANSNDGLTVRITSTGFKSPQMEIRIARVLAAQSLIAPDEKSLVDIFIGTGADAGRMKVASNAAGERSCYPKGKGGALRIVLPKPPGSPDAWQTTPVEPAIEDGGFVFPLPWYRRPADRCVDEIELPALPPRSGDLADLDPDEREALLATLPAVPATLDAIEEAARPAGKITAGKAEPARTTMAHVTPDAAALAAELLADIEDRPINGTVKHHVYADSPSDTLPVTFTHNGRSVKVEPQEYRVLTKLYAAWKKKPGSFLDYAALSKAAGVKEIDILHVLMTRLTDKAEEVGLVIGVWKRMGYWMKEEPKSWAT